MLMSSGYTWLCEQSHLCAATDTSHGLSKNPLASVRLLRHCSGYCWGAGFVPVSSCNTLPCQVTAWRMLIPFLGFSLRRPRRDHPALPPEFPTGAPGPAMLQLLCVTSCSPALEQDGLMFPWAHHPSARGGFDCVIRALCWLRTCCDARKVIPLA